MDGLSGQESVLDLTCGSGVFLVEALRRLVHLRARGQELTRELIRSTLYKQIYGVDISEAAIRVAAFSLYLAALELDPDPQPPHALKFQPLIGKTLLIGDARTVEQHADGKVVLTSSAGLTRFDLIVGNPPWSFRGEVGTIARRETRHIGVPAQPRGEGLDFVLRAAEFSHDRTRFGIILSAMPFFSRSGTGMAAAQHVIRSLAPITIVNLSNLSGWLFATATMPAVALFARHRPQTRNQITVVQIPWTASAKRTQAFQVSPSNIITLSQAEYDKQPLKLKAAAVGTRRDLLLLDTLCSAHSNLGTRLSAIGGSKFSDGLTHGRPENQTMDARVLKGLEILRAGDAHPFLIADDLERFSHSKAQRPRTREIYRAPLVIVKEMMGDNARAIVTAADRDLIFTDAYFAASLPAADRDSAHLLAAILSSSVASWFFLMTSSEFGIWKRKLLISDVVTLPTPDLKEAATSKAGKRLLQIEKALHRAEIHEREWTALDEAVLDLYQLDASDRIVVQDGLFRASWQWQVGRLGSVAPADARSHVLRYANVFLSVIDGWLSARNKRHMRAEVFDLPKGSPLRVVRFVLEDRPGKSVTEVVDTQGELDEILARIGKRLNVKLATALSCERELRIHGRREIVIIKPSARRYWLGVSAMEDADAAVSDSFTAGES
jgi:hypothetical protein